LKSRNFAKDLVSLKLLKYADLYKFDSPFYGRAYIPEKHD